MRMTIDGKSIEVAEDRTILEACREHGFYVPTLCYHPALEPYGGCRLCVVEAAQPGCQMRLVAACVYPCEEGIEVSIHSERVMRSRRMTTELLLAGAYNSPEVMALAEEFGLKEIRYKLPEENACILCGRCVRACEEIVGVSAISVIHRGIAKQVSTPFEIASSRCIECGTCVLICPTGAIKMSDVTGYISPPETAYRLGHYRFGGELDLRPNFVENITSLLESQPGNGSDHD